MYVRQKGNWSKCKEHNLVLFNVCVKKGIIFQLICLLFICMGVCVCVSFQAFPAPILCTKYHHEKGPCGFSFCILIRELVNNVHNELMTYDYPKWIQC